MGSLLSETFSTGVVCGIRNPEFGIRNWCILRNSEFGTGVFYGIRKLLKFFTFKMFHFSTVAKNRNRTDKSQPIRFCLKIPLAFSWFTTFRV